MRCSAFSTPPIFLHYNKMNSVDCGNEKIIAVNEYVHAKKLLANMVVEVNADVHPLTQLIHFSFIDPRLKHFELKTKIESEFFNLYQVRKFFCNI